NGNALTGDLQHEIETASALQLDWFFDQWLTRPGFPDFNADWRYDSRTRRMNLQITQNPRFKPFRFPLELEIVTAEGKHLGTRVEVLAQATSQFTLEPKLDWPPKNLVIDPDVKLLAKF